MGSSRIVAFVVSGCLALFPLAGPVTAQSDAEIAAMTPDQLVQLRQDRMRENAGIMSDAETMDVAQALPAAETLLRNFTQFPLLFREGSIVGDSRATPLIWEDWEGFVALFDEAQGHAEAALVAAQAGDVRGFNAALEPLGQLCGTCHGKYRGP